MVMKDYTGGHLSANDSGDLIDALNEQVIDAPVTFYKGGGYHNLMFIKSPPITEKLYSPNELIGEGGYPSIHACGEPRIGICNESSPNYFA